MYFGGTVIASAWGAVALASVWWKNMSEKSAFLGMLLGFIGCAVTKGYSAFKGITLPIYLDSFFVGIILSVIGMAIGSKTKATEADVIRFHNLHVKPEEEKNEAEKQKTHNFMWIYLAFGLVLGLVFVFAYAIPYMNAIAYIIIGQGPDHYTQAYTIKHF